MPRKSPTPAPKRSGPPVVPPPPPPKKGMVVRYSDKPQHFKVRDPLKAFSLGMCKVCSRQWVWEEESETCPFCELAAIKKANRIGP